MRRTYYRRSPFTTYKKRKKFRGIIITKPTLIALTCVISAVVFLFTAWNIAKSANIKNAEKIMKTGMAYAVPFLSYDGNTSTSKIDITGATIVTLASPIFGESQNPKSVKKPPVARKAPKVTVKEVNAVSENLNIKNESKYAVNTAELLNTSTNFKISKDKPSVLIVHTHASESYTSSEAYSYVPEGNYRTQNTKFNMIRVGEELAKSLEKSGIKVIHDKTINDYPSYNSSYAKAENVIRANLKKYPSICIVLDIHRDAVGDEQNGVKFTSTVEGEKAAQPMVVCGTDQNLENPNWRKNLSFALKIQQYFESEYPSFMRPLNLRSERFNMHLTTGSLLIEIGTNSSTLDEALACARCLGKGIGEVICRHSY